jgi:dUTP pyrophosphatase
MLKFGLKDLHPYNQGHLYQPGDRIAQIIILPYPNIEFEQVEELTNSERGSGGFGSTGE